MSALDWRLQRLAIRQGGHITHAQLNGLGLTNSAIRHRIARGLLIAVFRNVYAVGHLPTNPLDRAHGALLACGAATPGITVALAHHSAATLWDLTSTWRLPFTVVVTRDRRPAGIDVHLCRTLLPDDVRTHRGLTVTSPALTVLHIAPTLTPRQCRRAVEDLRFRGHLKPRQLIDVLERFPRHPGARHLRDTIPGLQREPARSGWEDEWPGFAATHQLPPYETNVHVAGHRVDVLFTPDRLIVELDGWAGHKTRAAFERDRRQDADILTRTGIPTVRITHGRFHDHAAAQAAQLRTILRERRPAAA